MFQTYYGLLKHSFSFGVYSLYLYFSQPSSSNKILISFSSYYCLEISFSLSIVDFKLFFSSVPKSKSCAFATISFINSHPLFMSSEVSPLPEKEHSYFFLL